MNAFDSMRHKHARNIVRALLKLAFEEGWRACYSEDGSSKPLHWYVDEPSKIEHMLCACDLEYLLFHDPKTGKRATVAVVWENDEDVLSDWTDGFNLPYRVIDARAIDAWYKAQRERIAFPEKIHDPTVMTGSRWHKACAGTLRNRIVLRDLSKGSGLKEWSVHTQVQQPDGSLSYSGGYYFSSDSPAQDEQVFGAAIRCFMERSKRFEHVYRNYLED